VEQYDEPDHQLEERVMATLQSQLITVENQSQNLSPQDLFNLVWAVNYQILYHYGRSVWVTGGQSPQGHLVSLPSGAAPPAGAWNLILMDHSDQQGALGYHEDATGTALPYADVFVADAVADGSTPSAVASHEALEMLVDPDVANVRTAPRSDTQQVYIVELCDAVQGNDYDVGAPEGHHTGVMVADFCLPAWWKLGGASGGPYSFRESVRAPWQLAPQGYISVAPQSAPGNWSQIFGKQMDRLPTWASRLPRIHGSVAASGVS
jgi:hypothetical protein